jgi:putative proteasome-type protease
MTYCCGMLVKDGLVMIADTRTNAGVDNISTFRKLVVKQAPGEHVLALATAGSLSVTQSAISMMHEGVFVPESNGVETLGQQTSMFRVAQFVGHALSKATADVRASLQGTGVDYGATMLVGGQVQGGPLRLFMVYGAGNFIECGVDAPFLQIGEPKYGKPILDRALHFQTELYDALKTGLISFELTMRSNLAVGAPLDLAVIRRDALATEIEHRIEPDEPYFRSLSESWSEALRAAQASIPRPPYRPEPQSAA